MDCGRLPSNNLEITEFLGGQEEVLFGCRFWKTCCPPIRQQFHDEKVSEFCCEQNMVSQFHKWYAGHFQFYTFAYGRCHSALMRAGIHCLVGTHCIV